MPKLTLRLTEGAFTDLARVRAFLQAKNPGAAERSGQAIARALHSLEELPEIGRPIDSLPEYRELLIEFGVSGYVALYRVTDAHIVVVAIRHQREAGYQEDR